MKLLAFDYGASSGRAILGDFDGERLSLRELHRFPNDPVQLADGLYWDILRLFHEMMQGISKAALAAGTELSSIGIDTWGVDVGLLDKDGRLLANPYHYRNSAEATMNKVFELIPGNVIYERTGIQLQPFNTLFQLFSLKTGNPDLLDRASAMLFIPDLLRYFLTGEKTCEYTIASTSQMIGPKDSGWDKYLLEKLGIPLEILTNIVDAGEMAGRLTERVAGELGTGRVPLVAVAEHDTGSAVISVPAGEGPYAYISSGTWSLLGVESEEPIINDLSFSLNYTNEGGYNRSTRLLKNIMGLWIFQECKREWEKEGAALSFDDLVNMAYASEPFLAFIDPDDITFFSPGGMPRKIREYCKKTGQKIPGSKGQVVRCIMESLALKYRMAVESLEEIVGYKIPVLHVVGGGSKNKMLNQFTANATARPVITGPAEATAIGNLIVQLMALKEIKSLDEGRTLVKRSETLAEFMPQESDQWEEAYDRFIKVVSAKKND
ncbi:MAG: rhamnulokinase [Acetivibrionales bacterium]